MNITNRYSLFNALNPKKVHINCKVTQAMVVTISSTQGTD